MVGNQNDHESICFAIDGWEHFCCSNNQNHKSTIDWCHLKLKQNKSRETLWFNNTKGNVLCVCQFVFVARARLVDYKYGQTFFTRILAVILDRDSNVCHILHSHFIQTGKKQTLRKDINEKILNTKSSKQTIRKKKEILLQRLHGITKFI